ncbi:reverse transcriptase RNA-dependent DNA polymerase [Nitzschia inconspicua]|uniref:Reverse transcriptase RNA-dependent DNA polymerase n=1 Tax=Nitzschia inconspicua TaxID=303405 RepID=A0A9K3KV62_9STRA|nr:reverse transcriptase RNA-dependent DNA polymerase [Nitzschia inconspicua]
MTTTTSDFPHDPLTPITGRPTSDTIYTLTCQIYANAKSIETTRGGGDNGHLALVMDPATYLLRAGEAYVVPPNPGPHPDPVAGATNAQITAAANAYANAVTEYALHKKTMKALLHQLLAAVEPTYYEELEDLTFGYADLAPLTLLTHLKTEYGTITDDNLVANRAKLLTTWNPDVCDAGCTVTFTDTNATVHLGPNLLLTGSRDPGNGLWHLDLSSPTAAVATTRNTVQPGPTESAAFTIDHRTSPANLVAFAHASLFSPALSTLHDALRLGYLTGVPGLTAETLRRHPPHSTATTKGHLDQTRKNLRSTKTNIPPPPPNDGDDADDYLPTANPTNERTSHCFAATFEPTGKIYSNLTGKFVAPSSTGNNYILVVYGFDSNTILTVPMRNRSQQSHTEAFRIAHQRLVRAGLRPRLQLLDNECSALLKDFMHDQNLDFQLVPPYLHRRNAAERAIRTFKNHFIAGLCSTDPAFPIHLWDRLLPHAELTLNLLRGSRLNPKLSAWAQLHGTFDYNRTPLAPPGCQVLVHEKPAQRESWAPHATDGWYIGPALESYRCHTVWISETRRERITDTVSFFPKAVALPLATPDDLICASLQDILTILKKPASRSTPLLSPSNQHALEQLLDIFDNSPPPPLKVDTTDSPTPIQSTDSPTPVQSTDSPIPVPSPPGTPRQSNLPLVPAAPLRVPTGDLPPLPNLPDPDPAPLRVAVPSDDTTALSDATFPNLTGPGAQNRQRRAPKKSTRQNRKPPKAPTKPPQPRANPHVTRQQTSTLPQPSHVAAHLATTSFEKLLHDAAVPVTYHMALHGNAFNPDTGKIAEYAELSRCSDGNYWKASNAEEIGCLAQGYKHIKGTNTIYFIPKSQVPRHKTATYLRIVCAHRPEKENAYRVCWTAGGNLIDYPHDASTKTADIITVKTLINSTLSTPGAEFMSGDLKDFYLGTPMAEYKYMRIHRRYIPDDIFEQYHLADILDGDYVYVEIRRGMYGLPQAGRIANDYLRTFLEPAGYHPTEHTPGLWRHRTRPLTFSLVVDDFGVKYVSQDDVDHLLATLRQRYECKADWEGKRYCGLTLSWDYEAHTCDISMPGYVDRALTRFTHPTPPRPEHSPHTWLKPEYGAKVHFAPADDNSPPLDTAGIKRIQEIVGVFLFYARAVDSTMLPALGTISTQQAKPTTNTLTAITKFLNYAASNPDACVRYRPSGMHLHIESNASYLSEPKARSRYAGYHYLSEISDDPGSSDISDCWVTPDRTDCWDPTG